MRRQNTLPYQTETHALVSVKIATAPSQSYFCFRPNYGFKSIKGKKKNDSVGFASFARGREYGERTDLKIIDLLGDGLQLELTRLELLGSLLVLSFPAVPLSLNGGDLAFIMLGLDVGKP